MITTLARRMAAVAPSLDEVQRRVAGVALPGRVPDHITRLLALGLATEAPEDPRLSTEYEILPADDKAVREPRARADRLSRLASCVQRGTLCRSPLAQELSAWSLR